MTPYVDDTDTTNNNVRLYAEPQGDSNNGDSAGGRADSSGGSDASVQGKELTINIPKFDTDEYGGRVYNPWGVTFGDVNLDTRFAGAQFEKPRMSMQMHPATNYFPSIKNISTVCYNRSTVYNEVKIERWLVRHIYNKRKTERTIFFSFRREIYDKANSEECHTLDLDEWMDYQQCALRRNQRMEYYIPEYPRQQLALN